MDPIRINKYLSNQGYCSRRMADKLIESGRVKINGYRAKLGAKVFSTDKIFVNNKELILKKPDRVYLIFNKPVGVICTTDKDYGNNIIQYLKYPERIYPVGRLDVNSSGLIILTNDGEIVNEILKAKNKIEKEYIVETNKKISEGILQELTEGVEIEGRLTLPAKCEKIDDYTFKIILTEGRNRQIRKMCQKFKLEVLSLQRIRIGKLLLGKLKAGEHTEIPEEEIKKKLGI
jgi:23S rRNA pseudouridine2604 synthase